jgi:hypothetical protein
MSITTRNFEISQLMQRNNFFMIFQGVLLASILQIEVFRPPLLLLICITGVFVSYYQFQVACGSKFWQVWWENRVQYFEKKLKSVKENTEEIGVNNHESFESLFTISDEEIQKNVERDLGSHSAAVGRSKLLNCLIAKRFSVSRAPIVVSAVLTGTWALLALVVFVRLLCVK